MSDAERWKPGQDTQAVATARLQSQDPDKIHCPAWGVIGNLGDSICYAGVPAKVDAVQAELRRRVVDADLPVRVIAPNFAGGISDGQRNGTPQMRYSLIGRETTNDGVCLHLEGSALRGVIAVVACDKPPVGTLAAILESNVPAVIMSDGSIRPGIDSSSGEPIDIVTCFQAAAESPEEQRRMALEASPGHGSCGGMFTYNTMQSFIATCGMEPLHMVGPASEDPLRTEVFPGQLLDALQVLSERDIRPRDIVTPASLRNATLVAIAMGGSTNVVLHAPELARAAGIDYWREVITQDEFNRVSRTLPVLVNARPFGRYSMVDIDAKGGLPVIVRELLAAGLLDGTCMTCTGETLFDQVTRLSPPAPDGDVIHPLSAPFKPTGGLRLLRGNLAPDGGAVIKLAGVESGMEDGRFVGRARVFDGEQPLIEALATTPEEFGDHDMVVIRYEGPRGAPGMPEMLDPTSRITALCRRRGITIGLMTDARFSGGSVGLVIGHVSPEAALGGPIALIEDGDTIIVDVNENTLDCTQLEDAATVAARRAQWEAEAERNGGSHPRVRPADTRLLKRMRAWALPPLQGAGLSDVTPSSLSATPRSGRNVPAMGNGSGGAWRYTACYGWNWRSARTISRAMGSLALPMPAWLRMVVARCLVTRTALHADAQGIGGSAGPLSTRPAGPCPWSDVTDIVVWDFYHLRIIGLVRRGDAVGGGPAARTLASHTPQQSRPTRRRTFRRHPTYPAFIAPDGSPYDVGYVVTTNGWCVDTVRLQATVQHFAPRARFVDLSGFSAAPESDGPFAFTFEVLDGLIELIGWRRLGWLLGVAASAAVLAASGANLGAQSYAPIGVTALHVGRPAQAWRVTARAEGKAS